MFGVIKQTGAAQAYEVLHGAAARARDHSEALDVVADYVFVAQRRWWSSAGDGTWGRTRDKDLRPDRDPAYMHESGGLERSATVRGASRQRVDVNPTFLLVEVTHGLAVIHHQRGRDVMADPSNADADRYAALIADFIVTGRT